MNKRVQSLRRLGLREVKEVFKSKVHEDSIPGLSSRLPGQARGTAHSKFPKRINKINFLSSHSHGDPHDKQVGPSQISKLEKYLSLSP